MDPLSYDYDSFMEDNPNERVFSIASNPARIYQDTSGNSDNISQNRLISTLCYPQLLGAHQNQEVTQAVSSTLVTAQPWNLHNDTQFSLVDLPNHAPPPGVFQYHASRNTYTPAMASGQEYPNNSLLVSVGQTNYGISSNIFNYQQLQNMIPTGTRSNDQFCNDRLPHPVSVMGFDFPNPQSGFHNLEYGRDFLTGYQSDLISSGVQFTRSGIQSTQTQGDSMSHTLFNPPNWTTFNQQEMYPPYDITQSSVQSAHELSTVDDATVTEIELTGTSMGPAAPLSPTPSKISCFFCRFMHEKCDKDDMMCKPCKSRNFSYCLTSDSALGPLTPLELFPNPGSNTAKCLEESNNAPVRLSAGIFLNSRIDVPNYYLSCDVDVVGLPYRHPTYEALKHFALRERMQSMRDEAEIGWTDVLSCSLVANSLPKKSEWYDWVLNSAEVYSTGGAVTLQSALMKCSCSYIKEPSRPLYDLVKMTVIHASLYSIWHRKSSIIFQRGSDNSVRTFQVCPRLRAQIFAHMSRESHIELHGILMDSLNTYQQSQKETHLPIYLTILMLVLTYVQCGILAENKNMSYFNNGDENDEDVIDKKGKLPISSEETQLAFIAPETGASNGDATDHIDKIKTLLQILFKRVGKAIGPVLRDKIDITCSKCPEEESEEEPGEELGEEPKKKNRYVECIHTVEIIAELIRLKFPCSKCPSEDEYSKCTHNIELVREFIQLRLALQAQQADIQQGNTSISNTRFADDLKDVLGQGECIENKKMVFRLLAALKPSKSESSLSCTMGILSTGPDDVGEDSSNDESEDSSDDEGEDSDTTVRAEGSGDLKRMCSHSRDWASERHVKRRRQKLSNAFHSMSILNTHRDMFGAAE